MKFVKSAIATFATNILMFGISVITTIVTARILGTDGKGVIGVSNTVITFSMVILGFGLASSNIYYIGKHRDKLDEILGINFIVFVFSIFAMVIFYFLNLNFHFKALKDIDNNTFIVILMIVPLMNLKSLLINVILGLQEVKSYNLINMLDSIVTFALLMIFIINYKNPHYVIVSTLISSVIICTILCYIIFCKKKIKLKYDNNIFRGIIKYGFKAQIANVVQLVNYKLDVLIIGSLLTVDQVGIYTTAVQFGETLWKISGSVGTIIFPMTSSNKNSSDMKDFINKVTRVTFHIILLCAVILILISKPLVKLLLGKDFGPSVEPLRWIMPGIVLFSISNILSSYIAGIGKIEKNIIASSVSCIVTVVLDLTLIPLMGVSGAAIASSISYMVFTVIIVIFYKNITSSKISDILFLKKSDIVEMKSRIKTLISSQKRIEG